MTTKTCEIRIDDELTYGDLTYWLKVIATVDFDRDGGPLRGAMDIESAELWLGDDEIPLAVNNESWQEVVVPGDTGLSEAINDAIWQAAVDYGNDYWEDIRDDIDDYRAFHGVKD